MNPAYHIFSQWIKERFKRKVEIVDYGCGSGLFLEVFPNRLIHSYVGYEVNEYSLAAARQKYTGKQFDFKTIKPSKINMGLTGSVDAIVMIGVFQYLKDTEIKAVLNEAKRVLKSDGVLLVSTVLDYPIYKYTCLYNFILPNRFFNRNQLVNFVTSSGLKIAKQKRAGLIFTPLISHVGIIFVDALDKLIFRKRGSLGPLSQTVRKAVYPVMDWETKLPIDFGYTIYLAITK